MFASRFAYRTLGAVFLGLGLSAVYSPAARAQVVTGATPVENTDPGQYLGNEYKDEAAGFRITPPVNCRVSSRAGIELITFVNDTNAWAGTLQVVTLGGVDPDTKRPKPAVSLQDYGNRVVDELSKGTAFKGVQVLEKSLTKFQDKNALRLTTSMQGDLESGAAGSGAAGGARSNFAVNSVTLIRRQLIIETGPSIFYVLTFYTPIKDKIEGDKTFDAVVNSLELFSPDEMSKRRIYALEVGKDWLSKRVAEEFQAKMIPPQWFKIVVGGVNGKEVGGSKFEDVEIAKKPGLKLNNRNGFQGVQVQIYSWTFGDNQTVAGENYAFWAYSKDAKGQAQPHYSMWANLSKRNEKVQSKLDPTRLVEAQGWTLTSGEVNLEPSHFTPDQVEFLKKQREEIIARNPDPRKVPPPIPDFTSQYHLRVTLSGDTGQQINADDSLDLRIPPDKGAPLPKIFEYMWPRMVDVTKPLEMSFLTFNESSRKIAHRTLIVTGKREFIPINGRQVEAWKCIDELDPGSTTLWVDKTGRIISLRTSDQTVLLPTTLQELQQHWGSRIPMQQ